MAEMRIRLEKQVQITGKMICVTGLTIGTGDVFGIGGIDKEMIRTGRDNQPYIPGSSLKGKMRHLFELMHDENPVAADGTPHSCKDVKCAICRIFGAGDSESSVPGRGPTRLIVRDAYLETDSAVATEYKRRTGQYVEVKAENVINRLDGQAMPRRFERVPKGMEFRFNLVYRWFTITNGEETYCGEPEAKADINGVLDALLYVQRDYLGASGSRGYGKVKFLLKPTNDEMVNAWLEAKINPDIGLDWE